MSANILERVGTIVIPATTNPFVPKEKFMLNADPDEGVLIGYIDDNFNSWFLNGDDGKIEDSISEQTLFYHKLRQSSVDGLIITELGGEEKAETTLSEMFFLMEKQKCGEDGVLNGYANIFYIKDSDGVLRVVRVFWGGCGWGVRAYYVGTSLRWLVGYQVFSGNSVLESSEPLVSAI